MRRMVLAGCLISAIASAEPTVVDTLPIDTVWAGHPVGFCLMTHGEHQYVGYYNAERQMVVASRKLDRRDWLKTTLPEQVAWDSHNSIAMAVDRDGYLHLSGNMHGKPLVYFRSAQPWDAATFERVTAMVGTEETRVTYPNFFEGPGGALHFTYRDGGSGAGNQIYNIYDPDARAWRRLLDTPLTDGRGEMNAYFRGPVLGPDGFYHLAWVWRDTPDCATNHHVSYAKSRDLVHWERGNGEPVTLPMTIDNSDVVDPVPPGVGVINGNVAIGFHRAQRTVISYHKYDADGYTQVYNARLEDGAWKVYQTSAWTSRWDFQGNGSIPFDVRVSPVTSDANLGLVQPFSNAREGSGRWILDPETLKPRETLPAEQRLPNELRTVQSTFPGMQVQLREDTGKGPGAKRYLIRWETLGSNRDRPRDPPWPEPSQLVLCTVADGQ